MFVPTITILEVEPNKLFLPKLDELHALFPQKFKIYVEMREAFWLRYHPSVRYCVKS